MDDHVCPPTRHTCTRQTSPGEYNEAVFKGLDYALDEARKRGIRVSGGTWFDGQCWGPPRAAAWPHTGLGTALHGRAATPNLPPITPAHLQLLLSLTDNWQQTGGADEFVRWAGGRTHEDFFSSPAIKQLYK